MTFRGFVKRILTPFHYLFLLVDMLNTEWEIILGVIGIIDLFILVPAYWPPDFFNILQFVAASWLFCTIFGCISLIMLRIIHLITLLLNKIYERAAYILSRQSAGEEYEDNGSYSTNYFTPRKKGLDYFIRRDAQANIYNSKYIGEDKTD